MKKFLLVVSLLFVGIQTSFSQENPLDQSFLFDEEDIIIRAEDFSEEEAIPAKASQEDMTDAVNQAKNLLNQRPVKLPKIHIPTIKNAKTNTVKKASTAKKLKEAPFGLFWGADQTTIQNQGVTLQAVEIKDYENSFLAKSLPKPLSFFDRVFVVFGKDDELYRILSYSQLIDDDSSASKTLEEYNKYAQLLEKKYGNKKTFFTPAVIEKKVLNDKKEEIIKEDAPLGNPDFLNQLASGQAVLYSTYNNKDIAAALTISVDGEKKSYIVIDYKNLEIIKKQEATTLDAL